MVNLTLLVVAVIVGMFTFSLRFLLITAYFFLNTFSCLFLKLFFIYFHFSTYLLFVTGAIAIASADTLPLEGEVIYQDGLVNKWQDWSDSPRILRSTDPVYSGKYPNN